MRSGLPERIIRLLATLLIVTFLTSMMFDLLPGDPALAIVGGGDTFNVTPERIEAVRHQLGLDEPVPIRYAKWLGNAITGDLGTSYRTRQAVSDAISERLPVTIQLMIMAQLLACAFALIVAPLAASRPNRLYDRATTTLTFGMLAIPTFIGGLILLYVFAVRLNWLPATGFVHITDNPIESVKSLLLPAATLAAPEAAVYTRLLRAEMVNTMREDYILMAQANGLPRWRILFRHALKPSSMPMLTAVGISVGGLIGGSVIVESMFGLPGIGRLAVDSVTNRDLVTVQGIVALVTIAYVSVNFLVDMVHYVVDPRVRHGAH
jgi:peptide/nickel transport system permease protein